MDKLKQLTAMLELLKENTISPKQLADVIATLVKNVNQAKADLNDVNRETLKETKDILQKAITYLEEGQIKHKNATDTLLKKTEDTLKKAQEALKEIQKIEVKDGINGTNGIDGIGVDGKDGSPDTAGEIADKLETLKGDKRLDASAIKNLPQATESKANGGGWRNLHQLHDVTLSSPTNNQVLKYNSTTSQWENGTGGGSVGPGTINELAYFDTANTVASLAVATYPSLTELSYGKGVTSAIQTQLDAKVSNATHTGEVTGATALTIANNAVITARIADNAVTNAKIAGSGTRDATTFYRGDGTFATPAGGGDALVANPLSQFAQTTSLQLKNTISDETGSGALTFATAPTFTTNITTPLIIGGTAVGSGITYKSTTGAGTAAGIAHQFIGGTDGATVAMTLLNNGNVGIGTDSPSARLHSVATTEQLRVGYDASNYLSTTISSTGSATLNLVGTSPEFTFSDAVNVPDEAYGAGWDGNTEVPTKNAVYDKIETLGGSGDMVLASAQTNTGAKTFLDTTFLLRNVANTFNGSFVNTNTANRIYTLKDAAGTLAFTSDITGTNSGTNTGDNTVSTSGAATTAVTLLNARTIGGVSFDGSANITVATATGGFTISGGNLALGANSITMSGSIGVTGTRVTKGWFTDLEVTNNIVGGITGNAATVTTNANLTGVVTSVGNATAIADGAIANAKLAALTASEIVITNTSGVISSAAVATYPSLTELTYVKGVTSSIQTQITAKMTNPMTTGGDVIYGGASGTPTRLANGTAGQVLQSNGTTLAPSWATLAGGGNAQTADPLSQFASTTSLQLLGVMSDETGTGALVFGTSPTLTLPVVTGTPVSAGQVGRDATQKMLSYYDNGQLGNVSRTLAVGAPAEALTNSTSADQDFTSIFTIPANYLVAGKVIRVTIGYQSVTGSSSVTFKPYLKLGTTKVVDNQTARNLSDNLTRSAVATYYFYGTAAAGAAANVETTANVPMMAVDVMGANSVAQPVALATNGTLAITPGISFSGTGSTETWELRTYVVEELN